MTNSVFTRPVAFRCVVALRTFCTAVLCGGVFLAAVLWFEAAFNPASPGPVEIACAVTILFLVGLRIGGDYRSSLLAAESGTVKRWFVGRAALYAVVLLLDVWVVAHCSGGLLVRWLPFGVAVLLPWRLRKMATSFRTQQAWRPTRAGFRPSWRAVFSWPGFPALMNLDAAFPSGSIMSATTNITDTVPDESAGLFLRQGDYRSAAYCEARTVEYLLARNRISDAETRIRAGLDDERLSGEPAFMAAQAEFLVAVGDHDEALGLLQEARARSARPPVQLDSRLLAVVVDAGREPKFRERRWSEWRRARLVWKRQPGTVLLGLAADAWLTSAGDGDSAQKLAYQVCRLPDRLAIAMPADDFNLDDYEQACMAKGLALETAAQVYEQRGQHADAAAAFLEAYEEYGLIKDRRRGGRCVVLGFVNALTAGYDGPEQESHALDMIRVGLQIVEDDRGTLRGEKSRVSWIASQREIYAATFRQLTSVRYHQAKAAELGLWLLESLHRSLTAGLLVQHGAIDADSGLLAAATQLAAAEGELGRDLTELRDKVRSRLGGVREAAVVSDATDTESALARLGGRTAILYHCWRGDDGWTLHSVLVSAQHGLHVHRGHIPAPATAGGSSWLTAAGAFDAIAAGDETLMSRIYQGVPVGDRDFPLWEEIAQALFPGSWRDMLCSPSGPQGAELLIVPDGPIAGLPLGALPGSDGRPLLASVAVALVPALSMLSMPGEQPGRMRSGRRIAVVHRDNREVAGHTGTALEVRHWLAVSDRMQVVEADDQASIAKALQSPQRPDVIAISAHGVRERGPGAAETATVTAFRAEVRLRDGTVLSEESALRFAWPPAVILASCSVGAASAGTGLEPSGFPLSCLLRGATTVIGGVAPIPDSETTDVLCRIIDELPTASDTLALLQRAQAAVLSSKQASGIVTAVEIAGLTAWTTAPAAVPGKHRVWPAHWDTQGLPRDEAVSSGTWAQADELSEPSRRVLAYASYLAKGQAVGTLEFLAAAFTADSADWTGFAVACETGEPVLIGPVDETGKGTLTADLGPSKATITLPLATALQRGHAAARLMRDETLLPAHVILAAFLDDTTAAGQWIRRNPESAAASWPQYLSDRIFRADLPKPEAILSSQKGGSAETHTESIAGASIPEPPAPRQRSLWWLIPAGILSVLLILPATQNFANHMQAHEDSASGFDKIPWGLGVTFLGILLAAGKLVFLLLCGIVLVTFIVIVRRLRRPGGRKQQRRT